MSKGRSENTQSRYDSENSQVITLFLILFSIIIGTFTLLKSFFDNGVSLLMTCVLIIVFIILIRIAASYGILRVIGRWLSGK